MIGAFVFPEGILCAWGGVRSSLLPAPVASHPPTDSITGQCDSWLGFHPSYPLRWGLFSSLSGGESAPPGFGSFSGAFTLMWVISKCIHRTRWAQDPPSLHLPQKSLNSFSLLVNVQGVICYISTSSWCCRQRKCPIFIHHLPSMRFGALHWTVIILMELSPTHLPSSSLWASSLILQCRLHLKSESCMFLMSSIFNFSHWECSFRWSFVR